MGKVEILTLIAGVVLSIALALIVVPMFGTADNVVKKQKINVELISIKEAIKMVYNIEPDKLEIDDADPDAKDKYDALGLYLKGLKVGGSGIESINHINGATPMLYKVEKNGYGITITSSDGVKLDEIYEEQSSFDNICPKTGSAIAAATITCKYDLPQ